MLSFRSSGDLDSKVFGFRRAIPVVLCCNHHLPPTRRPCCPRSTLHCSPYRFPIVLCILYHILAIAHLPTTSVPASTDSPLRTLNPSEASQRHTNPKRMLADPSNTHHQYNQCQYNASPSSHPHHASDPNANPFVVYSRSLHDYTLRLWTESRRIAEEKAAMKAAMRRAEEERRQYDVSNAVAQAHAKAQVQALVQAQVQVQMQLQAERGQPFSSSSSSS